MIRKLTGLRVRDHVTRLPGELVVWVPTDENVWMLTGEWHRDPRARIPSAGLVRPPGTRPVGVWAAAAGRTLRLTFGAL